MHRCETGTKWGWDWKSSLAANDDKTLMPGMQILRGIDGLRATGVRIIVRWNQSNWPGMIHRQPARARAASLADRLKLCQLWQHEHSYQSFPTLLGCPGRYAAEYEELCSSEMAIVRIPCAAIDLSSDPVTAGGIFDASRWFRVSHCTHPPKPCRGTKVVRMLRVATVLSVYPKDVGHFVPEQLPRILLLHHHLPTNVPILVADAPATRRYLQPLLSAGIIPPSRLHFHKLAADGTIVHADEVYTVLSSHFSNVRCTCRGGANGTVRAHPGAR